jgi:hypothetical protein
VANHSALSQFAGSGGAVPTEAIVRVNHARNVSQGWPNLPVYPVESSCLRFSRLCALMNPCPAGLEIHLDLARYCVPPNWKNAVITFINLSLRSGQFRERRVQTFKTQSGPMIRYSQFTNLRMRTFIATPNARNVNNTEDPP